jgi:hypothetical protein
MCYGMQGAMSVAGTSAIPYYYWCKRVEDRRTRRGEEGISTLPLRQLSAQRGTNPI